MMDKRKRKIRKAIIGSILGSILIGAFAYTLVVEFTKSDSPRTGPFSTAAVSSDGTPCAKIAVDILEAGGEAIDAAIAASICSGVVNPHSMGLGGGFLLTYYNRIEGKAYTLNSREVAPLAATEDMYGSDSTLAGRGPLAVAVPGEVRGYQALYDRFGGGVPWATLFEASIDLCEQGHPVSFHLANALHSKRDYILDEPTLYMFVDEATGDVYNEGDILYLPKLGETLRIIQQERDAIHNGSLTDLFVEDLQELGGIITKEDMWNYESEWDDDAVSVHLENQNLTMYSIEPAGSGALLAFIMNVLDDYNFNNESLSPDNEVLTHQRIAETFKYAYASRTYLGDHNYVDVDELVQNLTSDAYAEYIRSILLEDTTSQEAEYYGAYSVMKEDHGTSHVSVLAPNGDAVAVTGTINSYFGAVIASNRTGIIFNNEMDDFSAPGFDNQFGIPPSSANFIAPGKRPLSSMCPAVFANPDGDVRLVIGAAGGTRITSAVAYTAIQNLWFGKTIENSTDTLRMHHQLYPMTLRYEEGFSKSIQIGLENIGHITDLDTSRAVVSPVSRESDGLIYAATDFRKSGQTDGY